jgi:hypothetical protein
MVEKILWARQYNRILWQQNFIVMTGRGFGLKRDRDSNTGIEKITYLEALEFYISLYFIT